MARAMILAALRSALAPALIAVAGCSSTPTQPDGGPPDGGPPDTPDAGDDAGPPLRTATTRALLGTATTNLLLDPFVTTDASLGHFVGLILPVMGTQRRPIAPGRSFHSQSPAGVAVPVAALGTLSNVANAASVQIVAPFPGGSGVCSAQIWASSGDAKGNPTDFDAGGKGLTVSLLPNDLPDQTYPLTRDATAPLVFAGRQWVKLSLAATAPLPQGGWFLITVDDPSATFRLQAPEVVPAGASLVKGPPHTAPRTDRDRAAIAAYPALTHQPPP